MDAGLMGMVILGDDGYGFWFSLGIDGVLVYWPYTI